MGKYIIRRLLTGLLVVLCVTVIIFGIMQAMPGNPIDLMVDTPLAQAVSTYRSSITSSTSLRVRRKIWAREGRARVMAGSTRERRPL